MGMLRRRGNTRSEEKKLKAIEIEKTENKIEQMEAQQEYQAVADAEMIDELEDTYELASDIYEEYVDRVKLYLWELQDARDTELNNFANTILQQERYFNLYTEWLQDAEDHAALLNLQIIALAAAIDANMEEQWEEFFGKTASEMALQALKDINAEIDKIKDATGDEDDDDGDSGGVDDDVPEPPKDIVKTVAEHAAMLVSQGNGTGYYKVKIISSSGAFRAKGNAPFTDERSKAAAKAGVLGYAKDFYPIGKEIGWQRGTHYVPETQPYMLHRGETVSPAGQSGGSSSDVVYITINNNNAINSELDAERFAKIQAETIRQRLSDETGKTRYRLR